MSDKNDFRRNPDEVYGKAMRAGRRTYFFDVRATRGEDYYLTITESKKHSSEYGEEYYKKHKIYLYKEDFESFKHLLNEMIEYIERRLERKSFEGDSYENPAGPSADFDFDDL
ncbi:DUF3276 family protein [bacterium]|nr:DUF3276 family protein [bacterium]